MVQQPQIVVQVVVLAQSLHDVKGIWLFLGISFRERFRALHHSAVTRANILKI